MNSDLYSNYEAWKQWSKADFLKSNPGERAYLAAEFKNYTFAGKTVLELGFGNGSFLAFARAMGASVYGTEVQPALVALAQGAGIVTLAPDLSDAAAKLAGPIDLVVAFDVFEHLTADEITQLFTRLAPLVRPGGKVMARFPNCQSPLSAAHQFGDMTHKTQLSGPILGQLLIGRPWQMERAQGPARVIGGGVRSIAVRAKYMIRSAVERVANQLYGLSIEWSPNLVVWLTRLNTVV